MPMLGGLQPPGAMAGPTGGIGQMSGIGQTSMIPPAFAIGNTMVGEIATEMMRKTIDAQNGQTEIKDGVVMSALAAYLNEAWQQAKLSKRGIEEIMLDCLRRRNGIYSAQKLSEIRQFGGSEVWMNITNIKCRAAESWIGDILFPPGDKPWSIEPTPLPDLPPYIVDQMRQQAITEATEAAQGGAAVGLDGIFARINEIRDELDYRLDTEAKARNKRMQKEIEDQLAEGGWEKALKEFISDVATYPTGIIRGPVLKMRKRLRWSAQGGKWGPQVQKSITPTFYRVSPFDLYPSADARDTETGALVEHHRLSISDLTTMRGIDGYRDEEIANIINDFGVQGRREWLWTDTEIARLSQRPQEFLWRRNIIDALEYTGKIPGKLLKQWGMTGIDEEEEYEANAWWVGPYVFRAVLNDDPLGRRNYFKASFEELPGQFWNKGIPQIITDTQDLANGAGRALSNNMALASGPMAEVQKDRLAPGENAEDIGPWRIFYTVSDPNGGNTRQNAINFFQPGSNAQELMAVYNHFSKVADDQSGIPAYSYTGQTSQGGAQGTASGLSMLMSSASRGIKKVVNNIDGPIEGTVSRLYNYNMLYHPDQSIKGDALVQATGSRSLIAKEQQAMRRTQLLQQTQNPMDMQIMGIHGRANLLRSAIEANEIDPTDIIPEIYNQPLNQQSGQPPGQPPQGALPASGQPPAQATDGSPAGGTDHNAFQAQPGAAQAG